MPIKSNAALGGFQAYVGSGGPGQTKFFSIKAYGSEEEAHAAAQKWETSALKAMPKNSRRGLRQANNSSGLPGLQFLWKGSRGRRPAPVVVAAIGDRRPCRGVMQHGPDAIMQLVRLRVRNGYPAPDASDLVKAFGRLHQFVKAGPR